MNVVRNSDVTKKNVEQSGYWDHSLWEETQKKGDAALQKLIAEGLINTSVTVTLTGLETWTRPWVRYEIVKSFERGNGLITLYVNRIATLDGKTDPQGPDPLSLLYFSIAADGKSALVQKYESNSWKPYMTISVASLSPAAKKAGQGHLSQFARSYDWVANDGYNHFAEWIETAAKDAGK